MLGKRSAAPQAAQDRRFWRTPIEHLLLKADDWKRDSKNSPTARLRFALLSDYFCEHPDQDWGSALISQLRICAQERGGKCLKAENKIRVN